MLRHLEFSAETVAELALDLEGKGLQHLFERVGRNEISGAEIKAEIETMLERARDYLNEQEPEGLDGREAG